MELSVAVEAVFEFHGTNWFAPVGRTLGRFKDWTVAMAYHGSVYLTDRHAKRTKAIAAANQHSSNTQRRCLRLLAKYRLTATVGSITCIVLRLLC